MPFISEALVKQVIGGYSIALAELRNWRDLELPWKELEKDSSVSVFQSWLWVSVWLETVIDRDDRKVNILTIYDDKLPLAYALIVKSKLFLCKAFPVDAVLLGECGGEVDEIVIEHNSPLIRSGYERECIDIFTKFVINNFVKNGCVVHLPGLKDDILIECDDSSICKERVAKYYWVDIDHLRKDNKSFESVLSKSTRRMLNQTKKVLSSTRSVVVEVAENQLQAEEYYDSLVSFHASNWNSRGKFTNFTRTKVQEFHRLYVKNNFENQGVLLVRLMHGKEPIAYMYLLRYKGNAYFYQSGNKVFDDNKVRVGLLFHKLLIEKLHADDVIHSYDFLAGDYRYKKSLSTNVGSMRWIQIANNSFANRMIHKLGCNYSKKYRT